MEYEALWWGNTDGAFFDYDSISKNRKIAYPMLSRTTASLLGNSQAVQIPQKRSGELRIISADVALMISKKNRNDATAVFINQMIPTKAGRYMSNVVFADAYEGLRTDDQALVIRKLYDEYGCDYIVLDCQGLGLGVFDCLARDIVDPDTGEVYPALSCCNNEEMAMRCRVPGAEKSIWAIKASAQFNSDCAFLLREAFRSARIRLLTSEFEAEDALAELKGYSSLSPTDKLKLQLPYIHTTLLVDELVKLQHEENGGKVRIYEKSGMRKDRYSSLSYNYYVATQLEAKYGRRHIDDSEIQKMYIIRPPTQKGKAVNQTGVRQHKDGWR